MTTTDDPIRFAERLLALLEEGSFTATYKFAVLLGLMDLCLEHSNRFGEPAAHGHHPPAGREGHRPLLVPHHPVREPRR